MLGISLKEGEFATVGNAIIRVGRWSRVQMRLMIEAPMEMNVLRFDASGKLATKRRRVVSRQPVGQCMELKLRCGHTITVPASEGTESSLFCPCCEKEGAELYARIMALAAATDEDMD